MNWGLIGWFAGIMLTFAGLKFVFVAIKTLLSKETMTACLDGISNSVNNGTKKFETYLKRKAKLSKVKRQTMKAVKQEEPKPIITVR